MKAPEASCFSPAHPKLPRQLVLREGYVEDAFEGRTPLAVFFSILLGLALEQVLELREGREGRRLVLLSARRRLI